MQHTIYLVVFVFFVTAWSTLTEAATGDRKLASPAELLQTVEQLSPEQAYEFQTILQAKMVKPIPQGLFTRMAVSLGGSLLLSDPDSFKASIAGNHGTNFDTMHGLQASLLWRLSSHFYLGVGGLAGRRASHEKVATQTFEDVYLYSFVAQVQAAYKINITNRWFILPLLGVGLVEGRTTRERSNDSTSTTFIQRYDGIGFSSLAGLSLNYHLNRIFTAGIDAGYLYARVSDVKRSSTETTASPGELNFSGPWIGLRISYNLR